MPEPLNLWLSSASFHRDSYYAFLVVGGRAELSISLRTFVQRPRPNQSLDILANHEAHGVNELSNARGRSRLRMIQRRIMKCFRWLCGAHVLLAALDQVLQGIWPIIHNPVIHTYIPPPPLPLPCGQPLFRYEVQPRRAAAIEAAGLEFVGRDETGDRMEIAELPREFVRIVDVREEERSVASATSANGYTVLTGS